MKAIALILGVALFAGCASIKDANRAAAQEDAVLRAWDKEAFE